MAKVASQLGLFLGVPLPRSHFCQSENLSTHLYEGVLYTGKTLPCESSLDQIEFLELHLLSLLKDRPFKEAVILPIDAT